MSLFQSDINLDSRILLAYLADSISLNSPKLNAISQRYETLDEAVADDFDELRSDKLRWLKKWDETKENLADKVEALNNNLLKDQISLLLHTDPEYPTWLKNLDDFPLALYYQGDVSKLSQTLALTVVGSRNVDIYGQLLLEKILGPVCKLGVGVVSGLALGIDAAAHKVALDNGSWTIGVIGSGLDQRSFYPNQNWALRTRILNTGGLVVSEYPPNKMPNVYTFPQRNRILAALTDLTWVAQASLNSGSLITALRARDLGKTVATTPADIRDVNFGGNLKLLKEGSQIITESEDILTLLGLKTHPEIQPVSAPTTFASPSEKLVYEKLTIKPTKIDDLASELNMPSHEISTHLTMLELNNLVLNIGENQWIRRG